MTAASKWVDEAMKFADEACDAAWDGGAAWDFPNLYRPEVDRRDNNLEALRSHLQSQAALCEQLAEAARLVIAWYDAEENHAGTDFYERMQMCRDSEDACRAALLAYEGSKQ